MQYLILLFLVSTSFADYFSYDGYKVYRVVTSNENQHKALLAFAKDERFDFWAFPRSFGKPIDVMVEPSVQNYFLFVLNEINIPYTVLIDNVEDVVKRERTEQASFYHIPGERISFIKYYRHSEINAYLDQIAVEHPNLASVETIGRSYEGRDLKVIKISTDSSANKPVIFIDAAIHAREWATPALATYVVNQLLENPNNSALLEKVDWHILPVINADGYEYTHTNDRFWRKTRSKGKQCDGVDGNRNFDYHWGTIGASSDECSITYKGLQPFSEPETQALADYIFNHRNAIKMYLSIHTYGSYILHAWGYTGDLPNDAEELENLGNDAAKAIESVNGTRFTVGSFYSALYPSAGTSVDWVKGVAGVDLSYTIELRGGGAGFDPPPSDILPIVTESWEGIKVFYQHVEKKFG